MVVSSETAAPEAPARRLAVPRDRSWRLVLVLLVAVTLLGGVLRAVESASPDLANRSSDERGYARVAKTFEGGHFHGTSLHWPPGAPLMFAIADRIHPTHELRLAYWSNALVGTLLIPVVFLLGLLTAPPGQRWGRWVGLGAAALVAIYPPYVVMGGQLLAEPLGTLCLAGAVAATLAAWREPRWWLLVLAGVLMAGTVLTRADLILVPAILVVLTAWFERSRGRRVALGSAGLAAGACVVVMLPWLIVAATQVGHFVPVTEGDGSALFVGTYLPGKGTTLGFKRAVVDETRRRHPRFDKVAPYYIPAAVVLADQAKHRPGLSQDASLRAQAWDNLDKYALGQPLKFARMMWNKAARMWLVSSRAGRAQNIGTLTRPLHHVLVIVFIVLLLAAWVWWRPPPLTAFLAIMAYASLMHAVFVSKPRYALPLLPLLIAGGLAGLAMLATELARRRSQRISAPAQ
jgi:4-amino-4-deoxy-L-arabinose transferase-like glycosyltransferase